MKLMSDNISSLSSALVKAQKGMGNAVKDSKNPFFKSKYADLNAVREAVLPALNDQGISVLQPTVFVDGRKFVQTMFVHETGEYISGLTEIISAKETDAQSQGSGISYARRYGLQSLANIGADDDDGEGAVGRTSIRSNTVSASPAKEASGDLVVDSTKAPNELKGISSTAGQPPTGGSKSFRKSKPTTAPSEDL